VEVVERRAVRAVVLDAAGRLLLMRFRFPDGREVWATPGGGVDDGESDADALRRELAEELGVAEAVIGPRLWTRTHTFEWDGRVRTQRETIFLVRVDARQVALDVDLTAEGVAEARWWTLAELHATTEHLVPAALPGALAEILAGRIRETYDVGV
jgi:ADP-ribose pyrophosphatase YjhB (NUDIX family)